MKKDTFAYLSITDILETINKHYATKPALRIKTKEGTFKELSYIELGQRTVDVSSSLIKLGIAKNDKIAILSENRPEWAIAYFAIISCAGIIIPLDIKLTEKEIQFILNDTQAKIIFVSEKYLGLIEGLRDVFPHLKHIILLDETPRKDLIQLKDLKLKEGEKKYLPVSREDTAMIVYTSGTSGIAKGVELTYKNLLFQVVSLSEVVHYTKEDEFLSILPLNHMLEVTGGLIAPLYAGSCITYASTLKISTLQSLMKETHPTAMICVPLILKMFHDAIMKKIQRLSPIKQKIFFLLLAISKLFLKLNIRIGRLLFKSIHKEFGSILKTFVSGGAPLSLEVEINLNALGFRILQGYGLTETAPVISVNTFKYNKFGSVGKPLPEVEVKILKETLSSSEGEILTCGPHIMKGYFKNQEKTKETIKDTWLHTGDIGYIDKQGYLHISGRLKNLIVLPNGKKIFPEEIESLMLKSPYIKEICILPKTATKGLRKGAEEIYAVIIPNLDLFKPDERQDTQKIKQKLSKEISCLNKTLSPHKRLIDFEIWPNQALPKTATNKIKRKLVSDTLIAQ
ncbi:AMP-dependent synthetase/ligase [Candidatus Omnitrophota bacterium]